MDAFILEVGAMRGKMLILLVIFMWSLLYWGDWGEHVVLRWMSLGETHLVGWLFNFSRSRLWLLLGVRLRVLIGGELVTKLADLASDA